MNTLVGMLAFLSLFHLIGGIALGSVLRGWLRGKFACNNLFMLVWGTLFGGVPLVIGAVQFVAQGAIYLLLIEVAVFGGAILATALIPDWFLESFPAAKLAPIAGGGIFLLVGIGMSFSLFRTEPFSALVTLVTFGGMGGAMFIFGLVRLYKENSL